MSDERGDLQRLLERLVEAEVRFVLVGGFAVGTWGHVRGTDDIDLVPDPDPANLDRLGELLESLGGKVLVSGRATTPSAIRTFLRAGDKTLVQTRLGVVDVLQGLPQVPRYAELAPKSIVADLHGLPVRVCALEDLRAMKRSAGRAIDLADLEALDAAHEDDG